MSLERLGATVLPSWRRTIFRPKQALFASLVCIGAVCLFKSNILFTYGFDFMVNGTYTGTSCQVVDGEPSTYWNATWGQVHAILYSYVPFSVLTFSNVALIFILNCHRRVGALNPSEAKSQKQRSVSIMVIVMTLMFILFTGVGSVVNFFIPDLLTSYTGNVIIVLGDTACFLFHGLNILTLYVTNKRFRFEFNKLAQLRIRVETIRQTDSTKQQNTTTRHLKNDSKL